MLHIIGAGKIQTSEVAKITEGCPVVNSCRLDDVIRFSKGYPFAINLNLRAPVLGCTTSDALEPRSIAAALFAICTILGYRTWAKVAASIIQLISVFMVDQRIVRTANHLVHIVEMSMFSSHRSKHFRFRTPQGAPIKLIEPFIEKRIDNGYLSLSEGNEFDRLIQRLNNRLAVDATFGHGLTSHEIAVFSRISILTELAGGV